MTFLNQWQNLLTTMIKTLLQTDSDYVYTFLRIIAGIIVFPYGMQKLFGWFSAPGFGTPGIKGSLTVFTYDRRGRGESGDTPPSYAVEREVEDIAALLNEAGGAAFVWGMSSGAALALEAANRLKGIKKLALYEAPFIVDHTRPTTEDDWDLISAAVAADQRSDAVKLFLKSAGVPGFVRALMPLIIPVWLKLKAVAHTLPYDGAILRDNQRGEPLPASQWASVTIPTLVIDGGNSPAWMLHANRSLASVLPNAQYQTLQGQTHMLKPKAHAPTLVEFFKD